MTSTIHPILAGRFSPYAFDRRPVPAEDLRSLFEAARWAPSSYNEQPWRYIVAVRGTEDYERLLSTLMEANREWAQTAPVLAIGIVSRRFSRNGKENTAAYHDLGLASSNLTAEATARGLTVHQMRGILPERVRELFHIPEGYEAFTALAIGYPGESLQSRDRQRHALADIVFSGDWGVPAPFAA